jgi:hypothetical protein
MCILLSVLDFAEGDDPSRQPTGDSFKTLVAQKESNPTSLIRNENISPSFPDDVSERAFFQHGRTNDSDATPSLGTVQDDMQVQLLGSEATIVSPVLHTSVGGDGPSIPLDGDVANSSGRRSTKHQQRRTQEKALFGCRDTYIKARNPKENYIRLTHSLDKAAAT